MTEMEDVDAGAYDMTQSYNQNNFLVDLSCLIHVSAFLESGVYG
jgi:hypothetical protein